MYCKYNFNEHSLNVFTLFILYKGAYLSLMVRMRVCVCVCVCACTYWRGVRTAMDRNEMRLVENFRDYLPFDYGRPQTLRPCHASGCVARQQISAALAFDYSGPIFNRGFLRCNTERCSQETVCPRDSHDFESGKYFPHNTPRDAAALL
jgi:hypothetical protein